MADIKDCPHCGSSNTKKSHIAGRICNECGRWF